MLDCLISLGILVCLSSIVLMCAHVFPKALQTQLHQLNQIALFVNANHGLPNTAITTSPYPGTAYLLLSFESTNGILFLSLVEQ